MPQTHKLLVVSTISIDALLYARVLLDLSDSPEATPLPISTVSVPSSSSLAGASVASTGPSNTPSSPAADTTAHHTTKVGAIVGGTL